MLSTRTPMDPEAAPLAMEASGDFVPPQPIYDRVLSDLVTIRGAYKAVSAIRARSAWDPHHMQIYFDEVGNAAFRLGIYHAWDDLNTRFGAMVIGNGSVVTGIRFTGTCNILRLAEEYARLPHVRDAQTDYLLGDDSDVCLSVTGKTYVYIFDAAGGDCPSGCTEHTYWGFSTDAQGHVTLLGSWVWKWEAPEPAWFHDLAECRKWL
ncbi:MAG: hypothetical protein M1546_09245 [Chloroflexi bacterium]|nr:hypothetical protein [Chloroflexota bacterium]